jgi:hypothetical protein
LFFLISKELFTLTGCLKVRPLTRSTIRRFWQPIMNGWEKDLKCGRMAHGFFTVTTHWHTMHCLSRHFWRNTRYSCWNIHPHSPDLAFFLFPMIKSALRGTCLKSIDAVEAKEMEVVKKLSEKDLQHCFQQWKICMELCRGRGGDHFDCVISWITDFRASVQLFYSCPTYTVE